MTVVGLTPSPSSLARELGDNDEDDEDDAVDLWLEIPRASR